MWVPGTIGDLKNVWVRFMVWLERRGIQHDGMSFDAVTLGEFLDHVSSEAKAKAVGRKEKAAAVDAKATRRARTPKANLRRRRRSTTTAPAPSKGSSISLQ